MDMSETFLDTDKADALQRSAKPPNNLRKVVLYLLPRACPVLDRIGLFKLDLLPNAECRIRVGVARHAWYGTTDPAHLSEFGFTTPLLGVRNTKSTVSNIL